MLPKGLYQPVPNHVLEKDCAICLLPFSINDQLTYLPCDPRHHFHSNCIEPWLMQDSKCPICNTRITATEIKQCKSYEEITEFVRQKDLEECGKLELASTVTANKLA